MKSGSLLFGLAVTLTGTMIASGSAPTPFPIKQSSSAVEPESNGQTASGSPLETVIPPGYTILDNAVGVSGLSSSYYRVLLQNMTSLPTLGPSRVSYPGVGALPSPGGTLGRAFDMGVVAYKRVGGNLTILVASGIDPRTWIIPSGLSSQFGVGDLFLDVKGSGPIKHFVLLNNLNSGNAITGHGTYFAGVQSFRAGGALDGRLYQITTETDILRTGLTSSYIFSSNDPAGLDTRLFAKGGTSVGVGTVAFSTVSAEEPLGGGGAMNWYLTEWTVPLSAFGTPGVFDIALHVATSCGNDVISGAITDVCGNGVVEGTEQCDDGNQVNDDGCTNACTLPVCGDGITQIGSGEQCDDGNLINNDGCTNACRLPVCGDGILQAGEQCDDGNTVNGDCCSSTCMFESNGSACGADANQCTLDVCNGAGACTHPNAPISTPCDADGNLCTIDHCNGFGQCVFLSDVTCQAANPPCEGGEVCNSATGLCVAQPDAPQGTACNLDGNLCTIDMCNGSGQCVFVSNVSCQAANPPCEGGEVCDSSTGLCVAQPDAPSGTNCEADGNLCTHDVCNGSGQCVFNFSTTCPGPSGPCDAGQQCDSGTGNCVDLPDPAAGTSCNVDGNLCTIDQCNGSGSCVQVSTVTCPGSTGPCDAGQQCDAATGACVLLPNPPSGTSCEADGNLCTHDVCNGSGQCVFSHGTICPGPTGPCDGGTACTPETGACDPLLDPSPTTPCDRDNNLCTTDHCDGYGNCVFLRDVTCQAAAPPCEAGEVCQPSTGQCLALPDAPPSTPCEADGNLCTLDHCNGSGECVFMANKTCQSADPPCEGGEVCIPATGLCDHLPDAPMGTSCELDGNLCTIDACNGTGQCVYLTNVVCAGAVPPCEAGQTCNPGTGQCDDLPDAPEGTACEQDSNLCTLEHCDGHGSCVHFGDVHCALPVPPCEGGEECNPATGACDALPDASTNTSCEADGDLCTLDNCDGHGACVTVSQVFCPGPTGPCDSGMFCDSNTGACDDFPDPAFGTFCENDGNLCTHDHCDGNGSCVTFDQVVCPGSTGECDAGQNCAPATGLCENRPDPPVNTPCEADGDLCTIEHCDGNGSCVVVGRVVCPGPTGPCDGGTACTPTTGACDPLPDPPAGFFCERDGDRCTNDACNGLGQCVFVDNVVCPGPTSVCDGGEMCNPQTGACDPLPEAPAGTACDLDASRCTIDRCDGNGVCVHVSDVICPGPVPPCEAGAVCNAVTGACDPLPDAPISTLCERDANLCTIDHCDGNGQCVLLSNVVCASPTPPCESGETCEPLNGHCVALSDAPAGTPCEGDSNECTNDACNGSGVCAHSASGLCGACCRPDFSCVEVLAGTCNSANGSFSGAGTVCSGDSDGDGVVDLCDHCPGQDDHLVGTKVCCNTLLTCDTDSDCPSFGTCNYQCLCPKSIPTVSEWGLVVLTLVLLVGAKLRFSRQANA